MPILIGGLEASLRRLAHYDYWSDGLKRSVLLDANADLLFYGMGERAVREVADALASGLDVRDITFVPGTVYRTRDLSVADDPLVLPGWDELNDPDVGKRAYAQSFYRQYCNMDPITARTLAEPYEDHLFVVQNPPAEPLSQDELDFVYELPVHRDLPSLLRGGGRGAGHQGGAFLAHLEPRLLRRLQLLRPGVPPGKARGGPQPRLFGA